MPVALVDGFRWALLGGAGIAVVRAPLALALIRDEKVTVPPVTEGGN